VAARTGAASSGDNIDDRLVEAQQLAEVIRILIEDEIPKAALNCVETHRLMARVTGAYHLSEIAFEPECHQLRTPPAQQYRPQETSPANVSRCPYIQLQTDEAPHLCPTAELVQIKTGRNQGSPA
jgi:hypothetical protein